jgi:hypothetical protein
MFLQHRYGFDAKGFLAARAIEPSALKIKNAKVKGGYLSELFEEATLFTGMAFWSEQTNAWRMNETLRSHAISISELEKRTGIDFFCNLPDDVEAQVEKTFKPSVWSGL